MTTSLSGADATPAPTDDKLLELCWEQDTLTSLRLAYELGRRHGAAANSKPSPNFAQIRSSAPAGELMEMLADVWSEGKPLHPDARRAALRKVADWLDQQQEVPIGCSTASADYFSDMLREEANR